MFIKLFSYIFGNKDKKRIDFFNELVCKINDLEKKFVNYSDSDLKNNTIKYRNFLFKNNKINDLFIINVFSNIRESIKRVLGIRLFDVQLLGSISLYYGYIIEMKTGEGKSITATLPAYLYSLFSKGVHIVTVNDYLAKRDYDNHKLLFNFLGINIGINLNGMSINNKKISYLSDITYGTNNEFAFDYLKDNMVFSIKDKVQRRYLYYSILDEIDSILIDEARTPLIVSGNDEYDSNFYYKCKDIVLKLKVSCDKNDKYGDFVVDKKLNQVFLTEKGIIRIEELCILNNIISKEEVFYSSKNIDIMYYIISLLKAFYLYKKNVDYLIKDNKVFIIDEYTGRISPDRRWSDGLHQAIEVKENVEIQKESKILASITFQNYFRLYYKICGMTGTAVTEASEFYSIYGLDTVVIPTNKPNIRIDYDDLVYLTEEEKINAIISDIKLKNKIGQPVLVGTISVEKSEILSKKLFKCGIKHKVLNAKYHMFEASIISQAGKYKSVTISTNMAGRGTDIILGGNLYNEILKIKNKLNSKNKIKKIKKNWIIDHNLVVSLGGLYVIGTEKHESRRLDNQLRGRSGRQGDPGSSQFYISMEDDLMVMFSNKNIIYFMRQFGLKYGDYIKHPLVTNCIENAQKKIENRNFEIRKQLLEYDDIYNNQRKIIYLKRNKVLYSNKIILNIFIVIKKVVKKLIYYFNNNYKKFLRYYNYININFINLNFIDSNYVKICNFLLNKINIFYNKFKLVFGKKIINDLQKNIMLKTLDFFWKEYLYSIDNLKEGINLCVYAQKDPNQEYKIESFNLFINMLDCYYYETLKILINLPNSYEDLYKIINIYINN